VWTSLLTGVDGERHGISGIGAHALPGVATPLRADAGPLPLRAALSYLLPTRTVPTTGAARRVRTLWEIVALKEPSAAVGWWASWPARSGPTRGYVVTERLLPKLLAGAPPDRDTAPASLFDRLRLDFPTERESIRDEFLQLFAGVEQGPLGRWAWESWLIDSYSCRVVHDLMSDPEVRAGFVYLPGLDILSHRIARATQGEEASRLFQAVETLERYVDNLDELLALPLDAPDGSTTVVVADPGRLAAPGSEGLVVVVGREAEPGCVGRPVGPYDLAPLVLQLLAYPASAEIAGRPPASCLRAPPVDPGRVSSYGAPARPAGPARSDYDPEMVERLKSLGYLN
jgi:hypothetical protein